MRTAMRFGVTVAVVIVAALLALTALVRLHSERRYDGLHDLRAIVRDQTADDPKYAPAPDAMWFGMDVRSVPVGRVVQAMPAYTGRGDVDATTAHGTMLAPGAIPRSPRMPQPDDAGSYMLEPIGPWGTVFYGRATGNHGASLMLNAIGVGRELAEDLVRQSASDIRRRFHLSATYAPYRSPDGDLVMIVEFARDGRSEKPQSAHVAAVVLEARRTGDAFMAVDMAPEGSSASKCTPQVEERSGSTVPHPFSTADPVSTGTERKPSPHASGNQTESSRCRSDGTIL